MSSPYALFAPYAFFNSITKAAVGNVIAPPVTGKYFNNILITRVVFVKRTCH